MNCYAPFCTSEAFAKGLCRKHYAREWRNGTLDTVRKAGRRINHAGYIVVGRGGEQVFEHVAIAEKALGHALPAGAQVHHVDDVRANNANSNLVICPTAKYHALLHVRTRAMNACGNAEWRKCNYCKTYESIDKLRKYNGEEKFYHKACATKYANQRNQARKQ